MQHLRDALLVGARRAGQRAHALLISVTVPLDHGDPLRFFDSAGPFEGTRMYWERPSDGFALAAVGSERTLAGTGVQRFRAVDQSRRLLLQDAIVEDPTDAPVTGPLLFGGFAFDPLRSSGPLWDGYDDASLTLPRFVMSAVREDVWLSCNVVLDAHREAGPLIDAAVEACGSMLDSTAGHPAAHIPQMTEAAQAVESADPCSEAQWERMVTGAVADIRDGRFEKVVLARQVNLRAAVPFRPVRALGWLRQQYPDACIFAVARGPRCFLGASPELLVRLRHGEVTAACLAGSTARGADLTQDRELALRLLRSEKDRGEHDVVVRAIRQALLPVCADLHVGSDPGIVKLQNVQHLHTLISGRLRAPDFSPATTGISVLNLVGRLHPTPAVGGHPSEAALAAIREREGLDRGWYAGPVGWVDGHGDGEFAVGIRSALINGSSAALFAGCGIVVGSDPVVEYAESALKLRPMLAALGAA